VSVAPLELSAVTVRPKEAPAVTAVEAAKTSLSEAVVVVPPNDPTTRLAIGEPNPVT
jgi:hypothetical protein